MAGNWTPSEDHLSKPILNLVWDTGTLSWVRQTQAGAGGGGTEYTVDAVVPANPTGPTLVAERDDQLSVLTEAEGDWTNVRASSKGAVWVTIPDVNGDPITSFGGGTEYNQGTVATATDVLKMAGAIRRDTAALDAGVIDGDRAALSVDAAGRLRVTSADLTQPVSIAATVTVDSELPAAAALADNAANPTAPAVGAFLMGFDGTNWDRIRADGGSIFIQDGGNSITVDGSVSVSGAVDTELPAAAVLSDNFANPTAPAVGAFSMLWDGSTWDRAPGNSADGVRANLVPVTSGGCLISHLISAATTNATSVKASAGQVYGWKIFNNSAGRRYVKLHNTAGAPTAGVGVVMTIGVQAGVEVSLAVPQGIEFTTGIAFTTVTGIADSDATAVSANDLAIDIFYK